MSFDQPPHGPQDSSALGAAARSGTVTAGAILAWIASAFVVSTGVAQVIRVATSDGRGVLAGMDWAVTLTGVVVIAAGLLGVLLTTLAFRGSRAALIALTVLAAVCALVPIGATMYLLTSTDTVQRVPVRALWGIAWAAAAVGLLWSGRSWFRARRRA